MDITLAGSGVTYHPSDDQLSRVSLEFAAFDGEVGNGTLPMPDPSSAITVAGGRAAVVEEGTTLLSDGFVLDQERSRGPQKTAAARVHSFGTQDANALLGGFRVERSRGAETDYARVMAFAAADLPSADTTWVLNSSTVSMPAKKYDSDGGWGDLITDVVEFTGKTLFIHDKATGGRCLHYHLLTTGHTSGLTISDVPSALNGTTVFAPQAPTRSRTSVDLVNDVKGRDQSGRTSTAKDATSIAAHDADGLQHQALIDFDATSQADLDVKTAALLASLKDERDTWTCAIGLLDATALSKVRVGDLIPVTSSVMGLTASTQRIAHMTLTVITGENGRAAPGLWLATLELGAPIRRRARVKAGPAIAKAIAPYLEAPFQTTCQETFTRFIPADMGTSEFQGSLDWQNDTTNCSIDGDKAILIDNAAPYLAMTAATPFEIVVHQRLYPADFIGVGVDQINCGIQVFATNTPAFTGQKWAGYFFLLNYTGGVNLRIQAQTYSNIGGVTLIDEAVAYVGDPVGRTILTRMRIETDGTCKVKAWDSSATEPIDWMAQANGQGLTSTGSIQLYLNTNLTNYVTARYHVLFMRTVEGFICSAPEPMAGQAVEDERVGYGDGVTTGFLSLDSYVPGTLRVKVNGVNMPVGVIPPNDVTETSPATGRLAFAYAPLSGAEIVISYRKAS